MYTAAEQPPVSKTQTDEVCAEPVRLKTRAEVRDYLAKHLIPVRFGPKGQPFYSQQDLESLNVIFPDD